MEEYRNRVINLLAKLTRILVNLLVILVRILANLLVKLSKIRLGGGPWGGQPPLAEPLPDCMSPRFRASARIGVDGETYETTMRPMETYGDYGGK